MINNALSVFGSGNTINTKIVFRANDGTSQTINAKEGQNTINIAQGDTDLTLHLGGANNMVNVKCSQPTLFINGISQSDVIHFAEASDTMASATINKVVSPTGQHLTEIGLLRPNKSS
jgi:hypothetical protein